MTGGKKTQTTEKLTIKKPQTMSSPLPPSKATPQNCTPIFYTRVYIFFIQESVSDFIYLLVSQSLKIGGPLK